LGIHADDNGTAVVKLELMTNAVRFLGLSGVCSVVILLNAGCASVLPRETDIAKSRWESFEAVQHDYDTIIPEATTTNDLHQLGFDPYVTPNIKILNYNDLVQRFLPNASVTKEDLPEPVRLALEAKEAASAYEVDLNVINSKRYGNAFLDIFNFKRKTRITGWNYKALIVLNKDLVVYKLWSGAPVVYRTTSKSRPLGPLQEIDLKVGFPRF
jgi:hypothetical protein